MNQHGILTYVKMFLAFPYNNTIRWTHEKKESWVISEIYSPSTLQSNTLNIWRDFAWRVMLGISVPSTLPHTHGLRYEESCHAESFLKFTSPWPYLASTSFQQTWHIESLLKIYSRVPYKNIRSKSFNKQTSLASWDVFNMSFPMQVRTLKIGTKLKR